MAAEMGISPSSVGRIWAGSKPHLVKRFKISNDPQLEEKVTDVVGLKLQFSSKPSSKLFIIPVMAQKYAGCQSCAEGLSGDRKLEFGKSALQYYLFLQKMGAEPFSGCHFERLQSCRNPVRKWIITN